MWVTPQIHILPLHFTSLCVTPFFSLFQIYFPPFHRCDIPHYSSWISSEISVVCVCVCEFAFFFLLVFRSGRRSNVISTNCHAFEDFLWLCVSMREWCREKCFSWLSLRRTLSVSTLKPAKTSVTSASDILPWWSEPGFSLEVVRERMSQWQGYLYLYLV